MGKSHRASFTMRFLGMSLLAIVLAATVQAEDFTKEKIQLGKKKCLCDFSLDVAEKCKGTAKCDKKCSGSGEVEIGGCSFTLVVKKGKGKISKCSCETAPTLPPTGSGSGETPVPMTGSGSGETPVPITGSGSEEPPMPITGSGSGPVPITGSGSGAPTAGGEGMQCSCKCDCPDRSGECDCDCNCPMTSKAVNCAPGFCKVCPMMGDACPQDMEPICPNNAASRMAGGAGDGHMADRGCQCVPDFLMDMVKIQPLAPAGRMTAVDRAMTKANIQVGKKKCKCSYEMNAKNCKKSTITCDKKCSGKASGVELEDGMYMLDIAVKKGKVTIAKCDVQAAPAPTGTGGGSGGMGSGSASGNGGGGMGGIGSRCACVSMGMGGTGPAPTGSGSGPVTLLPPTGSGSGSGMNTVGAIGAPWSAETVEIVKKKMFFLLKKDGKLRDVIVAEPTFRAKYFYESPNYPLPEQKIGFSETTLRLAFHACLKYEDGSGGCNGCLDLDKYELSTNAKIPMGANNGLNWAVAVLEALYLDKEFPRNTGIVGSRGVPDLDVSLVDMGVSRADLWAFAGIVTVESFILKNHEDCEAGKNGEKSTWCEGMVNGNWTGCEFNLNLTKANMKFETGRSDCTASRLPAYLPEPLAVEVHPDVRGNGTDTTTFFREQFNFTMRETVAIMGAHTIGQVHSNISLIPYSWTREGTQIFNNEYYRIMAKRKMYALHECVGNELSQPGEGDFLNVLEGKRGTLNPLNVTELTGKMSWFHTYLRCPDCKGLAVGKFTDFESRYEDVGGVDYCCGLDPSHPLPDGYECPPECVFPSRKDEAFTNADMGLMFDFRYDAENHKFSGCPGFDNAEDKDFTVGKIFEKPDCPYNKMLSEEGTPIHAYVEEYADNQELWAEDFGSTFKRMLRNGYGDQGNLNALVSGPDY